MSTPLWRQMYNAWEQAVTPGLQEVTASTGFRDLLAVGMKTNADIAREVERASRQWLHLWNLPAASDVRRLRQQVAGLERELVTLRHELGRHAGGRDAATTNPISATSTDGANDGGEPAPLTTAASSTGRSTRASASTAAKTSTNGRTAKA